MSLISSIRSHHNAHQKNNRHDYAKRANNVPLTQITGQRHSHLFFLRRASGPQHGLLLTPTIRQIRTTGMGHNEAPHTHTTHVSALHLQTRIADAPPPSPAGLRPAQSSLLHSQSPRRAIQTPLTWISSRLGMGPKRPCLKCDVWAPHMMRIPSSSTPFPSPSWPGYGQALRNSVLLAAVKPLPDSALGAAMYFSGMGGVQH